jgi:glycosyltransferase involved in cell wall biosynthesis
VAPVSVIVPTFNRARFLGEAIESLLRQTCPPAEIIIVDDGSTDHTAAVAEGFGDKVRYRRKPNGGKASAVNFGLREATQEYVYVFDDDDLAYPDAIEKLLAPLEANSSLAFAHGGLTHFHVREDGRLEDISQPALVIAKPGYHFTFLQQRCTIAHNTMLVRRKCYDEVGYFNEAFKRSEDFEFLLRLTSRANGASVPHRVLRFRNHTGLRGDASSLHSIDQRDRIHFSMERMMFRDLRGTVALQRYAGKSDDALLDDEERFDAWLLRAISMAAHGLWQQFDEDIQQCAQIQRICAFPVSEERAHLLSQGFSHSLAYADEDGKPAFPRRSVSNAISALGRGAVRPLARGFYWAASLALKERDLALALRCLTYTALVFVHGRGRSELKPLRGVHR